MSQDGSTSAEMAESASVGQAGEPQHLGDLRATQGEDAEAGDGTPTPEQLDERNERFSGPASPWARSTRAPPRPCPTRPDHTGVRSGARRSPVASVRLIQNIGLGDAATSTLTSTVGEPTAAASGNHLFVTG